LGKGKKIPKPVLTSGTIPKAAPPPPRTLAFSFKYLDRTTNAKFLLEHAEDGYLETLVDRLREISKLTEHNCRTTHCRVLRSHPIDFAKTSEPGGFSQVPHQLREGVPFQFALTSNKHGRVHGLLTSDVFYVVWLDPAHKLYPGQ